MYRPLIDLHKENNKITNDDNRKIPNNLNNDHALHTFMDQQIKILQLQIHEKLAQNQQLNHSDDSDIANNLKNSSNGYAEQNRELNDAENLKKLFQGIEDNKTIYSNDQINKKNDTFKSEQLKDLISKSNIQNKISQLKFNDSYPSNNNNSLKKNLGAIPKQNEKLNHPSLEHLDISFNRKQCNCSKCYIVLNANQAILLRKCLHIFCINCLVEHIENSTDEKIMCPNQNNNINCTNVLKIQLIGPQENASKRTIFENNNSDENYTGEKLKEINNEEFLLENMDNMFRCAKKNCNGSGFIDFDEDKTTLVACPICKSYNCLICKEIHPGMTCKEFQTKSSDSDKNDTWNCNFCSKRNELKFNTCQTCAEEKSSYFENTKDEWHCIYCNFINKKNIAICNFCKKANDHQLNKKNDTPPIIFEVMQKIKDLFTRNKSKKTETKFWECNECQFRNEVQSKFCLMCRQSNVSCGRCKGILKENLSISFNKCVHMFCKNCIDESFEHKKCPIC